MSDSHARASGISCDGDESGASVLGAMCECRVGFTRVLGYCVDLLRVTCQQRWPCGGGRCQGNLNISHGWVCSFFDIQLKSSWASFSTPLVEWLRCASAMADTTEVRSSGADETPTGSESAAPSAPTSPVPTPSEPSSAGGSLGNSMVGKSDLLQKIKDLQDEQKALRDHKRKCAQEMKNALKRKKRLQGKAQQLSDNDLVEVLRMRNAKKESVQTAANPTPPEASESGS